MAKTRSKKKSSKKRRFRPKLPLEVGVALLSIPFTGAASGYASPIACLQSNDWDGLNINLGKGFLGFAPGEKPDLMQILSPFNFEYARYTKMLIVSGLISKVRKRLVRLPIKQIPIIGTWVS